MEGICYYTLPPERFNTGNFGLLMTCKKKIKSIETFYLNNNEKPLYRGFMTDAGFCGQKRQELQYYER